MAQAGRRKRPRRSPLTRLTLFTELVAEREADAAIADGRLPAEKRDVAINIGDCNIDRLRAWLNREDVPGLMPLPALHLTEAQ